jgi:hypothetical protein
MFTVSHQRDAVGLYLPFALGIALGDDPAQQIVQIGHGLALGVRRAIGVERGCPCRCGDAIERAAIGGGEIAVENVVVAILIAGFVATIRANMGDHGPWRDALLASSPRI